MLGITFIIWNGQVIDVIGTVLSVGLLVVGIIFVLGYFSKLMESVPAILAGIIFVVASLSDFIDGHLARKNNMVTDFGKVADAIADKVLVNGLLIVLACNSNISPVIPVVIITRDTIVDSLKMISGNKGKVVAASYLGKAKTMCMMIGLTFMFFSNLPFELFGIGVGQGLVLLATCMSVYSGIEYFMVNKEFVFGDM